VSGAVDWSAELRLVETAGGKWPKTLRVSSCMAVVQESSSPSMAHIGEKNRLYADGPVFKSISIVLLFCGTAEICRKSLAMTADFLEPPHLRLRVGHSSEPFVKLRELKVRGLGQTRILFLLKHLA
jgi:hypothetical protein